MNIKYIYMNMNKVYIDILIYEVYLNYLERLGTDQMMVAIYSVVDLKLKLIH